MSDTSQTKTVFQEAEDIIYGDREQTYGNPAKNLEHIADQWALYLSQKHGFTGKLSAEDVCWMMADLKKCREMNAHKRDNIVDAIGYIGLAMRVREHRGVEVDRRIGASPELGIGFTSAGETLKAFADEVALLRKKQAVDVKVTRDEEGVRGDDGWIGLPEGKNCFGECPVPDVATVVDARSYDGIVYTTIACNICWEHIGAETICAYRLAKPGRLL